MRDFGSRSGFCTKDCGEEMDGSIGRILRQKRGVSRAVCISLLLLAAQMLHAAEYHGRVRYGGVPVPGATVTLTQGSEELTAVTDSQGLYEFSKIAEGNWQINIELRGFA